MMGALQLVSANTSSRVHGAGSVKDGPRRLAAYLQGTYGIVMDGLSGCVLDGSEGTGRWLC